MKPLENHCQNSALFGERQRFGIYSTILMRPKTQTFKKSPLLTGQSLQQNHQRYGQDSPHFSTIILECGKMVYCRFCVKRSMFASVMGNLRNFWYTTGKTSANLQCLFIELALFLYQRSAGALYFRRPRSLSKSEWAISETYAGTQRTGRCSFQIEATHLVASY